jgi:hypothetical protein
LDVVMACVLEKQADRFAAYFKEPGGLHDVVIACFMKLGGLHDPVVPF